MVAHRLRPGGKIVDNRYLFTRRSNLTVSLGECIDVACARLFTAARPTYLPKILPNYKMIHAVVIYISRTRLHVLPFYHSCSSFQSYLDGWGLDD